MKKIIIAILVLISVQSFGQTRLYAIKINVNGTRDSFFTREVTRDSVFDNVGSFVTMSVEFGRQFFNYSYPAAFANFTERADGVWQTYQTPLSDASGMTGINADVTAALGGKLGTSGNGSSLTGLTKTQVGLSNVDNTSDANKPVSTAEQTALNLKANLASPTFTGTVGGITASMVGLGNVNNTSDAAKPVSTAQQSALDAKQATLVSGSNIKTINGATVLGSTDIVTTRKVAQADIASTSSATGTTTLFTPTADGFYRVAVYLKITTTGTSPVAGPVTITYQSADGSVNQSHVMLLNSVTGTVVTTTVNNSTTTGTVHGTMVIYAKAGVAITYAIAVSGTFGAGRYTGHLFCEQL